jgi:hypothetical protein
MPGKAGRMSYRPVGQCAEMREILQLTTIIVFLKTATTAPFDTILDLVIVGVAELPSPHPFYSLFSH